MSGTMFPSCCGVLCISGLTSVDAFLKDYRKATYLHKTVIWCDSQYGEGKSEGEEIWKAISGRKIGKTIRGIARENAKPGHVGSKIRTYIWYPSKAYITEAARLLEEDVSKAGTKVAFAR